MEVLKIKFHTGGREEALAAFEKEGFWQGEVIYYTKENVPLNVLVTVSQNLNDNSEVVGNLVLVKDISSLKKQRLNCRN